MTNDQIICDCQDVHKSTIESVIREKGLKTADQVSRELHLDKACGACMGEVQHILNETKMR